MAEWKLMYGGAHENPGIDREPSQYGRHRDRAAAVKAMLSSEGFKVPDLVRAVLITRAEQDPANFAFDSRPYSGSIKYWFERTDG